ncbi:MAG: hypothetical protein H0W18_15040 [Acidobacteria bacterium]|nr:hypothetical protein [Acidobacteriota bacterium]
MDRLLRGRTRARADVRPYGPCLDAETLAAWTDGSLTAVERTAAETHAADCARCLAVLAAIAKTTPPPSAIQRHSWRSFRWLLPLATAAVAISVWVLIPGSPGVPPAATPAAPAATPAEPVVQAERDSRPQARADAPQQQKRSPAGAARSSDQTESRRSDKADAKESTGSSDRIAERAPPAAAAAPRAELKDERARTLARAAAELPGVIVSPDPAVRWRIAERSVERSTDGGRTWRAQATGTAVDLLAGAAPAANVCWIVGRSGVVLLSTDGETWRRLAFPDKTADLVGVTARDAVAATVTTADGRKYSTTDAGRAWTVE